MHRRILSLAIIGFLSIIIINWSCTKLDTTNLGSDLIPAVDNVNTFADTLRIDALQGDYPDTTSVPLTDNHVLGYISNDPMFGTTEANIYMQLKPVGFPFTFGPADSLTGPNAGFDSVVLCLSYQGFYGDTNVIQQFTAHEVTDPLFKDTAYDTNYQPAIGGQIGSKQVDITKLDEYMRYTYIKDSVRNQIRIKLDPSFANRLVGSDSASSGTGNHAFNNDSIYRTEFKGLAVKSTAGMGNALLYINLGDTNTKIEVHYRIRRPAGRIDTTYTSFKLKPFTSVTSNSKVINASATANYIKRNRTGFPASTPTTDEIYLQGQPGTYASLKIPQLTGYSNRIIHRAEIIIEQIPNDPHFDSIFVAPNFLYLDLKDTTTVTPPALPNYKPIYIDLNPTAFYDPDNSIFFYPSQSGPDFAYFGGFARRKTGPFGGSIIYYNINISRYVQQLVKNQGTNYEMRLFPAYRIHYSQKSAYVPYNNSVAFGRVKVGSGTNPNYKMRLRIVYSKIK